MAAPTFRAAGAKVVGTTSALSVSAPAGVATGDLEILVVGTIAGGSVTITANGGSAWTALTGSPIDVTAGEKLYVWWRIRQAGDSDPSVNAGSDHFIAARMAVTAGTFSSSSPIELAQAASETTSDTSFSFATTGSTSGVDRLCFCICTSGADSNTQQVPVMTNAALTSLTTRLANHQTNTGGGGGFGCTTGIRAAAGALGTFACTLAGVSPKSYLAFAVKPGPLTSFGAITLPITFGKSVAGDVVANPLTTTMIDNFNRADGAIYAGAGADLWEATRIHNGMVPPQAVVVGNALGWPNTNGYSVVSKFELDDDFDFLFDWAVPTTVYLDIGVLVQLLPGGDHKSIRIGWDPGVNKWTSIYKGPTTSASNGADVPGTPPVAGEIFWLAKRGTNLKLYKAPPGGGPFSFVGSWTTPATDAPWLPGRIFFVAYDTTIRLDNLRGGPLNVPAVTHYGATSLSLAFGKEVAGRRKAFGQVALPVTFSKDVQAQRKTFGQISSPFIFTKAVAGRKTTFGQTTLPITIAIATAGIRPAITYHGALALSVTFNKEVQGQRKTFGQLLSPLIFGKSVQGQRKTFSQVVMPISATIATAGIRVGLTLYGAVSLPITFAKDIRGQRKAFGQVVMPLTFAKDVAGRRQTFGQIAFPIIFTKEAVGRKNVFGQLSMQTLFGKEIVGRRKTFSQLALPVTFSKAVAGQRKTFGRVALPIDATIVISGKVIHYLFGSIAMPLTFDKQVAAHRETFGQITAPLLFESASQGQRRTFGGIELPIDFESVVKSGPVGVRGALDLDLVLTMSTAGIRKLLAVILNDALDLHLGDQDVLAVYVGSEKVWP